MVMPSSLHDPGNMVESCVAEFWYLNGMLMAGMLGCVFLGLAVQTWFPDSSDEKEGLLEVPDVKTPASQLVLASLSVAGLVTSFYVLMGLDEFWGVYMSAVIAAAFCFAATWIAQEGRDPLWSFVILWFSLGFQFLTLCWFATLAAAVAALWEVGVMEADVFLVANKRYVQKEDKKSIS